MTIVSGFAGYNIFLFIALSLLTRGARFYILAGILNRFGDPIKRALDRHFATFMILILVMIVGGFQCCVLPSAAMTSAEFASPRAQNSRITIHSESVMEGAAAFFCGAGVGAGMAESMNLRM